MKKMNHIVFSFIFILLLSSMAFSDATSAVSSLVGRNAEGYLAPFGTMMGTSMNSGYYRKASPHKLLGFDLTLDIAYSIAPADQTTYNFVIPEDEIDFTIPFQFPKGLLLVDTGDLGSIMGSDGTYDPSPESLYQDKDVTFFLTLDDLLDPPTGPAQNIFGCTSPASECQETLVVTYDSAAVRIYDQVIEMTWEQVKDIEGIGKPITFENDFGVEVTIDEAYGSIDEFNSDFGDSIRVAIGGGLNTLPPLELPIPPGSSDYFPMSPVGLPMPIIQGSIGLPFHTEITFRGLFKPVVIPEFGTIKYGGLGAKIGISDYLSDYLYPEKDIATFSDANIVNIIQNDPSDIHPTAVDKAISDLKLQGIDVQEIDSLNYLLMQGDANAAIEIKNRTREALTELKSMPKSKKQKKKTFPIDLSLGYFTNDLELDLDGEMPFTINSTNRMITLQMGKTFNMPFIPWIGGFGIYGGLGFESSNLDLGYTLANPLDYGCKIGSEFDETNNQGDEYTESSCTGSWESGVPLSVNLTFPGDNKFRKLIGARMRILFVDAYVDYNMGASNAINAGLGITIR